LISRYALRHWNAHGLDEMDNKILTIIDKFKGGPVGFYFGWPYQKVVKLFEV
jgi:Holliday junction resolvasome RuvABC ATP-dependent DNA helicase subunit